MSETTETTKVSALITAQVKVSFALDTETFELLSEKELIAIAIAKAGKQAINWQCDKIDYPDSK